MPNFIKESIIYKLIWVIIVNPYNNSIFNIFLKNLVIVFKESFVYRIVDRYFDKSPYFLNSVSYKFFRGIIKIIDKIADFFHRVFRNILLPSKVVSEFKYVKYTTFSKKLQLLSILLLIFDIGYLIGGLIFKNVSILTVFIIFIVYVVLAIFGSNENCYKESFIYKIFKSW